MRHDESDDNARRNENDRNPEDRTTRWFLHDGGWYLVVGGPEEEPGFQLDVPGKGGALKRVRLQACVARVYVAVDVEEARRAGERTRGMMRGARPAEPWRRDNS